LTTTVDITNEAEREEEMHRLHEEAQGTRIIAAYDKLQSIAQLIAENNMGSVHETENKARQNFPTY